MDWIFTHFAKEETVGINTSKLAQECIQFRNTFEGCRSIYTIHMIDLAMKIEEMEEQAQGDSKIISIVSGVTDDQNKQVEDKTLNRSYTVRQSSPYDSDYARDVLLKYGIDFENI